MNQHLTLPEDEVWAVIDPDDNVVGLGLSRIGAWNGYFAANGIDVEDRVRETVVAYELVGFRCFYCHLVVDGDWAAQHGAYLRCGEAWS